ncbi:amylo-alpha-1,6-glucosidase [Thermodesulfobacteriota bacterium]
MSSYGQDILTNYQSAIKKEWLVTNGIGGYASSTLVGCNTRRYHGLLVASLNPPVERTVLVSKLEEVLHRGQEYHFLSTNRYPNTISPEGFKYAFSFSSDPFPKTVFAVKDYVVEKEVFMVHGENTTIVTYKVTSPDERVIFSFSPLIACRDFHWLMRENMEFFGHVLKRKKDIVVKPFYKMPPIHIRADHTTYDNYGVWYKNMEYEAEQDRGLNFQEDLFNVGRFSVRVKGEKTINVILSDHDVSDYDVDKLRAAELKRIKALCNKADCKSKTGEKLVIAADKFIANIGTRKRAIIAGYHWFGDWGRDALISIPGLLFTTKRYSDAKKVLTALGSAIKDGLVPTLFTDYKGEPQYNSIDTSLWFIYIGYLYFKETNDKEFMTKKLMPWFEEIFEAYKAGTRYNIKVDTDGLVAGGDETTQLTWMDVKIGDETVTPRHGKPVEVNALWYNALCILEELTKNQKQKKIYTALIKKVKTSFNKKFWNKKEKCLYDVVGYNDEKDESVRPNQIFAVSLKFSILTQKKEEAVFSKVQHDHLTPFGLRSLSKDSEFYHGRYRGNQPHRDRAYHQGTVWSWLIGPYIDAYVKLNGLKKEQKQSIRHVMKSLFSHLDDYGVGGISEIFDGDGPHMPRGCIYQAWSVAEVLRIKKLIS